MNELEKVKDEFMKENDIGIWTYPIGKRKFNELIDLALKKGMNLSLKRNIHERNIICIECAKDLSPDKPLDFLCLNCRRKYTDFYKKAERERIIKLIEEEINLILEHRLKCKGWGKRQPCRECYLNSCTLLEELISKIKSESFH